MPDGKPRVSLQPGMCLTIEPGLYLAWRPDVDCPMRYANIGIRIEDDVLVGEDGPVVLAAMCPKTITGYRIHRGELNLIKID